MESPQKIEAGNPVPVRTWLPLLPLLPAALITIWVFWSYKTDFEARRQTELALANRPFAEKLAEADAIGIAAHSEELKKLYQSYTLGYQEGAKADPAPYQLKILAKASDNIRTFDLTLAQTVENSPESRRYWAGFSFGLRSQIPEVVFDTNLKYEQDGKFINVYVNVSRPEIPLELEYVEPLDTLEAVENPPPDTQP